MNGENTCFEKFDKVSSDPEEEDSSEPTSSPSEEDEDSLEIQELSSASLACLSKEHSPSPLPLRTQIRLLIERALEQQLRENRSANPTRPWYRRQLDIITLKLMVFIMHYHRELFIIFLMFVSGLASLRNSAIKTRATPEPKPFFDLQALKYLDDFYRGEYLELVQKRINNGPAFVFYYAPWDSESVAAKHVFTSVARHFRIYLPNRIQFFAVNCWWPQGECRKNYKNLSHFPIFVAHVERNSGIIYGGPIREELMIKFLHSMLKPLTRIDNEDELWRFRAQHDAIMLSYFNFTETESVQAYETYRQMALRNFEADPFGQVGFGIFLRTELADKYFLTASNVVSLVLFNEIHTAKWTGDKDALGFRGPVGQVSNWVTERTKLPPITWSYKLRTGFANRPVALGPADFSDELSRGPVILLITRRYFPSSYSPFYAQVKEVALDYYNCNKSGNVTKLRRTIHRINSEWVTLWNSILKICSNPPEKEEKSCLFLKEQLNHWESKKNSFQRESLANYEEASDRMNFTGLSCSSERKFKFFSIDPVDVPYFVDLGFGGLGFKSDDDPVLFIIDAQNDMILPFSKFNITKLAGTIHEYSNEENATTFESRIWSDSQKRSSVSNRKLAPSSNEVLVFKLNSEELTKLFHGISLPHVSTPMFLMFTATFCGTCGIALASFVELSRFMRDQYFGVNITFAKIDMVQNSMPAGLQPDGLPSFLYLPGTNLSDARMFPSNEKISSQTLLRFLLAELDAETRIKLSLKSPGCNNSSGINDSGGNLQRQRNCVSNFNATARKGCIFANKLSVNDKLQYLFNEFNDHDSHVENEAEVRFSGSKTQDLDHLRSMRINLDVMI